MHYYMMIEPAFAGTYWCEQSLQGIRQEIFRNKGIPITVEAGDERALNEVKNQERPLLILVGSLVTWITSTVLRMEEQGIHCILLTAQPPDSCINASTISMDYRQAIHDLLQYLEQAGKKRVALWGVHPNSINDLTKLQAFRTLRGAQDDAEIFWNTGDVDALCRVFLHRIEAFDAVLCSNDIIAIHLQDTLIRSGVSVPEQMQLVSLGETRLAGLVKPGITTAAISFSKLGKNAVRLYNILRKNESAASLHMKLFGSITVRQSTAFAPCAPQRQENRFHEQPPEQGFYEDQNVRRVFLLENLISHCQPIDFSILTGLMNGTPYRIIAEETYTSENAIKYRIKRMIELLQCENKDQLVQAVRHHLPPENLPME